MNILVNENTEKFLSFLAACQSLVAKYYADNYPNNPKDEIVAEFGRRYVKLVKQSVSRKENGEHHTRSAWAFVDRTNGDVFKVASWNAPAKHARGNIFDDKNGMGSMGPYGPAYLR